MTACGAGSSATQAAATPGSITRLLVAGVLTAALALALPLTAQAQQWRTASSKDGIKLESRPLPGERFDELRASTLVPVAPETIADFLFRDYLDQENANIRRTFVKRTPELTIWSDVLTAPAVDPRCYSMQFERSRQGADGEVTVRFSSDDFIGPRPGHACIKLRARGQWSMRPVGNATRITYTSLTDIGGSTPAMLVSGTLSSSAVNSVRKVVAGALELDAQRRERGDSAD